MSAILGGVYLWAKAFHVMSVIAWMAGLFYLPRLFVYHAERVGTANEIDGLFRTMEMKLYRYIMQPAMIAAWTFGLVVALMPGVIDWGSVWPYAKLAAILAMTWFHTWCGKQMRAFAAGENTLSGRTYRMMNEVPTILMIVIVVAVIVRPL